ncbi:MAG TPA: carbohydrate ABC transporter permease [Aestuariivirga sp.]|nr:carbohydrate ABC transporter permease [Aestuariivirga sp.]
MNPSLSHRLLRDATAVAVVAIFMFPLFWWGLTSFKPLNAVFNVESVVWFDFVPTLSNYAVVLGGYGPEFFNSQSAIRDSLVVASGATALTLLAALPGAYAISFYGFPLKRALFGWVIFQRIVPPIAVIVPLVYIYHGVGLHNTRPGVIFAHATVNLPFALLLLKSFFDDVPRSVGEAAMIDGATPAQTFWRIYLPMVRSGIAATAVLCFIFSWTEFLMALFLTTTIRLLPVQLSLVSTATWGFNSALGTASIIPAFLFILLVQKHLVRGLTMGLEKG